VTEPTNPATVRFAWPDREAPLARVLPVILRVGAVERLVAPGEPFTLPPARMPVTAIAVVPGAEPVTAEISRVPGDELVLPFRTTQVMAKAERAASRHGAVAFGAGLWTSEPPGPVETSELTVGLDGDELRLSSPPSGEAYEARASVPARLTLAARTTPTRVVAVPSLGPGEAVVIDLLAERPFGDRPALLPSDSRSRLLLAYLGTRDNAVARVLAARLARVLGEQRPLTWSEPSLAQLLIGYALAADEDGPALAGWCRRTSADRLLGVDGIVLAALSAWHQERPQDAARLLGRAERVGVPVMSLGLELAVRLAFLLLAEGFSEAALKRLASNYSKISTRADPIADTITTPAPGKRLVSLEGRGLLTRANWALAYRVALARLPHAVKAAAETMHIVLDPSPASGTRSPARHRGVGMNLRYFQLLALLLVAAWLATLAATIVYGVNNTAQWELLVAPSAVLEAAVFTLLGVFIAEAFAGDRRQREHQLMTRANDAEERVRKVEEEAMRGRALAAALQAESGTEATPEAARHARLSRGLFGDLIGEQQAIGTNPASPSA